MSIKLRFVLTLGFLLLGLSATFMWVHQLEQKERQRLEASARQENQDLLSYWLDADAATFIRAARHLAQDKKTIGLFAATSPAEQLINPPKDFSVRLLRLDGTPLSSPSAPDSLPLGHPDFMAQVLQPAGCHFYFADADNLVEICAEPVAPQPDKPALGWLLLMRPWNKTVLDTLGSLTGGRLRLALPQNDPGASVATSSLHRVLRDWDGHPAANLIADFPVTTPPPAITGIMSPLPWFVLFGLLVIAGVALGLHRWVLQPLNRISASLTTGTPAPLAPLKQTKGELGRVAHLVESFFVQRDALKESEANLQQALDERIRLGRDLHDGVIQALYATGMGLAGIKAALQPGQTEAANGLDQCRNALNATILDLRNFITGLEPEALKEQTFGEAIALLLENARHTRQLETECEIDEDLANRLSISQRANILQITREAISNALRHGEANSISIHLQAKGTIAEFEITDNGRGFDPAEGNGNGGHGLDNLAGRARDVGAKFTLQSHPGAGTRLLLTFTPRSSRDS